LHEHISEIAGSSPPPPRSTPNVVDPARLTGESPADEIRVLKRLEITPLAQNAQYHTIRNPPVNCELAEQELFFLRDFSKLISTSLWVRNSLCGSSV
jgi:hypothetical protein